MTLVVALLININFWKAKIKLINWITFWTFMLDVIVLKNCYHLLTRLLITHLCFYSLSVKLTFFKLNLILLIYRIEQRCTYITVCKKIIIELNMKTYFRCNTTYITLFCNKRIISFRIIILISFYIIYRNLLIMIFRF